MVHVFNVIHVVVSIRLFMNCNYSRIVKLSSPNINTILLFGCMMTYSTVFMKTSNLDSPEMCKVMPFIFFGDLPYLNAFNACNGIRVWHLK